MRADLHLHSNCSDGKYPPEAVVERALKAGIRALALTDHDTVGGLAEAEIACARHGMDWVSGVEISAEEAKCEVHLLAYDFDAGHNTLLELFELQRKRRVDRARSFVEALRAAGLAIRPADESLPSGDDSLGRPHIARLLVEAGAAGSMDEAFDRFLMPGASTYVPKTFPSAVDAMEIVHAAGGMCVLAHPGHYTSHRVVEKLIDAGLDGIEAIHPAHDETMQKYYVGLARRAGAFVTGGSDYHGWRDDDETNLGSYTIEWLGASNLFVRRTL